MVDIAPSAVLAAASLDKLPLVDSGTDEPHDECPEQPESVGGEGGDHAEFASVAEDEVGTTSNGGPDRQEQKVVDTGSNSHALAIHSTTSVAFSTPDIPRSHGVTANGEVMLLLALVGGQAELDDGTGGNHTEEQGVEAEHLRLVFGGLGIRY